jgi:integrase
MAIGDAGYGFLALWAGLRGLRFHDLRHTAGTALVAGGIDVKTAQLRLGHASPVTALAGLRLRVKPSR